MKEGASLDYAIVDLTPQEQIDIKILIAEQEKSGGDDTKLVRKFEDKSICKIPWK